MLKAFCDRCSEEIPDYDAKKNSLDLATRGMAFDHFDLCLTCLATIEDQISDFIKGA